MVWYVALGGQLDPAPLDPYKFFTASITVRHSRSLKKVHLFLNDAVLFAPAVKSNPGTPDAGGGGDGRPSSISYYVLKTTRLPNAPNSSNDARLFVCKNIAFVYSDTTVITNSWS